MFHCPTCSATFISIAKLNAHKRKSKCVRRAAERAYDATQSQQVNPADFEIEDIEMLDSNNDPVVEQTSSDIEEPSSKLNITQTMQKCK